MASGTIASLLSVLAFVSAEGSCGKGGVLSRVKSFHIAPAERETLPACAEWTSLAESSCAYKCFEKLNVSTGSGSEYLIEPVGGPANCTCKSAYSLQGTCVYDQVAGSNMTIVASASEFGSLKFSPHLGDSVMAFLIISLEEGNVEAFCTTQYILEESKSDKGPAVSLLGILPPDVAARAKITRASVLAVTLTALLGLPLFTALTMICNKIGRGYALLERMPNRESLLSGGKEA